MRRAQLRAAWAGILFTLMLCRFGEPASLRALELTTIDLRFSLLRALGGWGWCAPTAVEPSLLLVLYEEPTEQAALEPRWARDLVTVSRAGLEAGARCVGLALVPPHLPAEADAACPAPAGRPQVEGPGHVASGRPEAPHEVAAGAEEVVERGPLARLQLAAIAAHRGGLVAGQQVHAAVSGRLSVASASPSFEALLGDGRLGLLNLTVDGDGTFRAQELIPQPRGQRTLDLDWQAYFAPLVAESATGLVLLDTPGAELALVRPAVTPVAAEAPPELDGVAARPSHPAGAPLAASTPPPAFEPALVPVIAPWDKRMWVNLVDGSRFPRLALGEVVERSQRGDTQWLREHLGGKVVLVGSASVAGDERAHLALPGTQLREDLFSGAIEHPVPVVEAQAQVINTLLTRQWLQSLSLPQQAGWVVALCMGAAWLAAAFEGWLGFALVGALALLHVVVMAVLFVVARYLGAGAAPLVGMLGTAALARLQGRAAARRSAAMAFHVEGDSKPAL